MALCEFRSMLLGAELHILDNFFSLTEDSEIFECFTCLPSEECYLDLPDDLVTTTHWTWTTTIDNAFLF